jgi:hypothetical protein
MQHVWANKEAKKSEFNATYKKKIVPSIFTPCSKKSFDDEIESRGDTRDPIL